MVKIEYNEMYYDIDLRVFDAIGCFDAFERDDNGAAPLRIFRRINYNEF